MEDAPFTPPISDEHDGLSAVTEARILRRKLGFWRRIAWLLVGVVIIVVVVIWQRDVVYRTSCHRSLEHYAKLARSTQLHEVPFELLQAQWRSLPADASKLSAGHYDLLDDNWLRTPEGSEAIPLAVCDQSHQILFDKGRFVLYRTTEGDRIEWIAEDKVAPIVKQAMSSGH